MERRETLPLSEGRGDVDGAPGRLLGLLGRRRGRVGLAHVDDGLEIKVNELVSKNN